MKFVISLIMAVFSFVTYSSDSLLSSPEGAEVFIISPKDGDTVKPKFTIEFGIKGMEVAPAGTLKKNTGHHHLLIDGEKQPDMKLPLGADVTHFGKGQTNTTITLPEGKHTLQLILGNYSHVPHDPAVISKIVTVMVKDDK